MSKKQDVIEMLYSGLSTDLISLKTGLALSYIKRLERELIRKNQLINKIMKKETAGLHSIDYSPEDIEQGLSHLQLLSTRELKKLLKTYND
jgi:hypothetical protein